MGMRFTLSAIVNRRGRLATRTDSLSYLGGYGDEGIVAAPGGGDLEAVRAAIRG
jgi:hypothetical protein